MSQPDSDLARHSLRVTVMYSAGPRHTQARSVELAPGATLADALRQSGWAQAYPQVAAAAQGLEALAFGVWGRKATSNQVLRDYDQVEIYRALRVDPKVARRERFGQQGAKEKSAGLFAQRRAGAKAGY